MSKKTPLQAADPDAVSEMTVEDAAKALDGAGVNVRVFVTKKGETEPVDRRIKSGDILSFTVADGVLAAVTVDGQKHRVELAQ